MFSEEKKDCEVLGKAKRPSELKEILERSIKEKDSKLGLLRDCGHPHIQQQQAAPQLVQKQTQMLGKKIVQSAKGHEIELFLVEFQAISNVFLNSSSNVFQRNIFRNPYRVTSHKMEDNYAEPSGHPTEARRRSNYEVSRDSNIESAERYGNLPKVFKL